MSRIPKRIKYIALVGGLIVGVCIAGLFWYSSRVSKPNITEPVERKPLAEKERAKATVAEFSGKAQPEYIPGIFRPQLPSIPEETLQAIRVLQKTDDIEYLADIAAILVRFAEANKRKGGYGSPMDRQHPLVKSFVSAMLRSAKSWDEIDSSLLAEWICRHRDKFGPSPLLDTEIHKWEQLQRKKAAELEELLGPVKSQELQRKRDALLEQMGNMQ